MAGGFFRKIFGMKSNGAQTDVESVVSESLTTLIERAGFELNFRMKTESSEAESNLNIELDGPDEELLKEKEGQLLDSFQLFLRRVVQHHLPDDRTNINLDCGGYREESNQALVELAEKLKGIALEKGKSVYFRALPPKDRKVIHQYLANDARVRSRSIGDGLYKKIKIYPVKGQHNESVTEEI